MRVYRYGLLAPVAGADLVREQMLAAHRYRNALTEIERGRRAAIREATSATAAAVSVAERDERAANDALGLLVASVKGARSAARARVDTAIDRAAVSAAREAHRAAKRALYEARAEARTSPALIAETDRINALATQLSTSARAHCGVYWGTYLLVEAELQSARKAPLYDGAEPNDPRYSRWTGDGQIGVQLQGGEDVGAVFGPDTRLRIAPVDERAWHSESRGERRRLSRTTLSLRVGSEGRDPVWAEWPMVMHRPLPKGGRIKCATVNLRRRSGREEWSVCITVDDAACLRPQGPETTGTVAVDLGWRQIGSELRVGAWVADDGDAGECRLSARDLSGLRLPNDLRGTRDQSFDRAVALLASWLASAAARPEWLSAQTARLTQWGSPGRLAGVVQYWASHRFAGDEDVFAWLESWRYHDDHLWRWEGNQRIGALRHRREVYRVFAAQLATRYRTVVLEKFDLRALAKRPKTEDAAENETARSNRQLAAPSELRAAIVNAATARGREVVYVDAAMTSRACHACGVIRQWDQAEDLVHRCGDCGEVWDQDDNASRNMLDQHRERLGAEQAHGVARSPENTPDRESKWARAKRMRDARDARTGAARNPPANPAE